MIIEKLTHIYESFQPKKTPEVAFDNEEAFISYLEQLDFIASGMEALVFLHPDKMNVIRLDLYALQRETIQALIENLQRKDTSSSNFDGLDELATQLNSSQGIFAHLRDRSDQRVRDLASKYNKLFAQKPKYSIPCKAVLAVNNKAVALVFPFIDGESMTEQEAEAFDKENTFQTRDANGENYRKNVTTWKNSKVRLDL